MFRYFRDVQLVNRFIGIILNVPPRSTYSSILFDANAYSSIDVTEPGIMSFFIDVKAMLNPMINFKLDGSINSEVCQRLL